MTAVTTLPVPAPAPTRQQPLLPTTMREAMDLGDVMATGKLVPVHLQKSPADCLAVILQAIRWQLDPFAVAQCTSVIGGKLMFEGKLVMAVVNTSGRIRGRLYFDYSGAGEKRAVVCSGLLVGEEEPVAVTVVWKDAKTSNKQWYTQPDQQLAYHSARVWARRYTPELMLGVLVKEEMEPAPVGPRTVQAPALVETPPEPPKVIKPPAQTIDLHMPFGEIVTFSKSRQGILEALNYMRENSAAVLLNLGLLDLIAEKMPEFAEMVAEVRAAATESLTPEGPDESWDRDPIPPPDSDDEPAEEEPEPDPESVRRQVARGARPPEMTESEASNLPG